MLTFKWLGDGSSVCNSDRLSLAQRSQAFRGPPLHRHLQRIKEGVDLVSDGRQLLLDVLDLTGIQRGQWLLAVNCKG